ncbi:MAG: hypothetical protein DHS80DRAFT_21995 [Piptocephalis tieghemiana]|nr:MAG: hypothetical protein DHS80DRAFT_21995 [Piptocephalis tieghemiana]
MNATVRIRPSRSRHSGDIQEVIAQASASRLQAATLVRAQRVPGSRRTLRPVEPSRLKSISNSVINILGDACCNASPSSFNPPSPPRRPSALRRPNPAQSRVRSRVRRAITPASSSANTTILPSSFLPSPSASEEEDNDENGSSSGEEDSTENDENASGDLVTTWTSSVPSSSPITSLSPPPTNIPIPDLALGNPVTPRRRALLSSRRASTAPSDGASTLGPQRLGRGISNTRRALHIASPRAQVILPSVPDSTSRHRLRSHPSRGLTRPVPAGSPGRRPGPYEVDHDPFLMYPTALEDITDLVAHINPSHPPTAADIARIPPRFHTRPWYLSWVEQVALGDAWIDHDHLPFDGTDYQKDAQGEYITLRCYLEGGSKYEDKENIPEEDMYLRIGQVDTTH